MSMASLDGKNRNPILAATYQRRDMEVLRFQQELDENLEDEIDAYESKPICPADHRKVFDMLRHINDPEHPLTLEQLNVVTPEHICVEGNLVTVRFTPTIPNCTMATLIGLMIRVKLHRSLPQRFKADVYIE